MHTYCAYTKKFSQHVSRVLSIFWISKTNRLLFRKNYLYTFGRQRSFYNFRREIELIDRDTWKNGLKHLTSRIDCWFFLFRLLDTFYDTVIISHSGQVQIDNFCKRYKNKIKNSIKMIC